MFAEISQFAMMHRDPTAVDVSTNTIGAVLGAIIAARWKIHSAGFRVNTSKAVIATTLASLFVLGFGLEQGDPLNTRGAMSPGTLEVYWKFDEIRGNDAVDSSGQGVHGRFHSQAKHIAV